MSLLEVIVALTIFAVFAGGVYAMLDSGLNLSRNNRNRSIGANLASQEMDRVRSAKFADLPLGQVDTTEVVDGVSYTVRRESEWVATDATASACETGGSTPNYLRVTVFVFWDSMRGVDPVESATILTPPVGAYDPTSGHIAVKVRNVDAEPAGGHVVRVTGPGVNLNITTTGEGCAFFGYLPANTYTVSMRTAGYVDGQGTEYPSQSVTLGTGQIKSVEFDYDEAATLRVSLTAPEGGTIPNNFPITLGNTVFAPAGTRTWGTGANPRVINSLFPSASGYSYWAGSCADADPEGYDSPSDGVQIPFWEGAVRPDPVHAEPGSTTNVDLELSTVNLTVVDIIGGAEVPVTGRAVRARRANDSRCPGGIDMVLGTTDAAGLLASALPFGEWYFQVSSMWPEGGSWQVYNVTIDPRLAATGDPDGPFDVKVIVQ